ncbi:formate dehydrogenase accessory protein FdhE [Paracoccus sp. PS-1]|uniref:formate dehydrogenase accessory protein FdhE n=1 Tax=unclassified Paracoccus (in: a-proteobacteria) TaxID=2688777 RepID=UPI00048E2565|nr:MULTISPECIES: formate dehydrogenase accessory protein FdhE [unclassified Paracoccus (in: a-proteobacteria)]MDQ7261765.1 formate dehydrogenase accessory protein FdhE [Paracoccus sp. PS1]
MSTALNPDPAMIGGVAKVPLARLPEPAALFSTRAERFDFLAGHSPNLAPYLRFLAGICRAQAGLVGDLPRPEAQPPERIELARASRMSPLDRNVMRDGLAQALPLLLERLASLEMPEPARLALGALQAAEPADLDWVMGNVLTDIIPEDSVAPHLFAAAALQVHAAMQAAALDAEKLVPIRTGTCPACGGRPATSLVTESLGAEGARYCACATCQTLWNEVRVKCLCCGSTKGISYRSVETGEATVKAEVCRECGSWVKILYQNRNPSLEPIADDVASLGLDLMMRDTEWKRGGFDPFLTGY